MNIPLRAHVGRRRAAIDRLRSLTTGVIVAGVAGTVGFGALAAATFTGKSTAQAATTEDDNATTPFNGGGSVTNPRTVPTDPNLAPAPTPRPARNHQGHAATGGSG